MALESYRDASASVFSGCDPSIHRLLYNVDNVKESEELDVKFLDDFDSYVEDINDRLTISRMVNDSVIRGMVSAVEQEAADRIAQKDLELTRLKKMMHVGSDKLEPLKYLMKLHESNIAVFSRLPYALCEHGKVLESLSSLKNVAKGQLKNLRIEFDQTRGHDSIKKINSVSELVGLGGILQESKPEKWNNVDKTLDSLRITLDTVYDLVENIFYSSRASLCQWQLEREFQDDVEQMVVSTCIWGVMEQFEERLWDQNAQWHSGENLNWIEKINEISSLRWELCAISKSLSNSDSGMLNSHILMEMYGDMSNNKSTDHFHQKVSGSRVLSSASLWEENGNGESAITMPENLDVAKLQGMSVGDVVKLFNVEMTKMKRNHDYKLQEMTEKYFSLYREYLKEKDSSTPFRKDKEFDVLRKKIPDVIAKLDRILMESENCTLLSDDNENIIILKDRLESLLSENHQLRDSLSEKQKEVNHLSSQVSDAIVEISRYSLTMENLLKTVEHLESAVEDAHIEANICADVYNCFIRQTISQSKQNTEDLEMEQHIIKEIYDLILNDASHNMLSTSKNEFNDSDLEALIVEGLCIDIFKEAFNEAKEKLHDLSMEAFENERVLQLNIAEKEKLQQELHLIASGVDEKEKLLNETVAALAREKEKAMLASQELNFVRDQTNQQQIMISKFNEESRVLKSDLKQALEELERCKLEICGLNLKLDQTGKDLRESNDDRRSLLANVKEKENILSLIKANEIEHKIQMESISALIEGLFKAVADFECQVAEDVKICNLRLENLSSQSNSLIQMANILKRKGLQYKHNLERKSSDLEKAEAEVDLLGDEVEVLAGLLEKIYVALDHYSPVLKHYPGIMEILKLVIKELSGESTKSV